MFIGKYIPIYFNRKNEGYILLWKNVIYNTKQFLFFYILFLNSKFRF